MKNTAYPLVSSVKRLPRRKVLEAALLALVASLATGSMASAVNATWTGATDGNFAVGTNWTGSTPNVAPGLVNSGSVSTSDTATFNNNVNTTIAVDAGRNLGTVLFDVGAGAFTLNGGPLWLTAGNSTSISMNGGVVNNQTINANIATTRSVLGFSNNSVTNLLTVNGSVTGGSGTTTVFTLGGTGSGVVSGVIAAGTSGTLNLVKSGAGTWTLSGSNSYNGTTAITVGALSVNSINNALGTSSTAIDFGNGSNTGTLVYTGGGETVTRTLNLAAAAAGGGVISSSGSGALVLQGNFTSTGAASKTWTLTGANTGNNTISGSISDNSGVNKTSLTKDGIGKWVLSGSNSYTGVTRLINGSLTLDYSAATAPTSDMISASSTLALGISGGTAASATLNIIGKNNAATTQSFATSGTLVPVIGAFHINLTPTGTGTVTFTLPQLNGTKTAGFTLDFTLPTGGTVFTTSATSAAGILPQGVTVNKSDFATVSGSSVVAFTAYTANTGTSLGTSSQVVNMSGGDTTLSAALTTVGAIRFNNAAARTITLNSATTTLIVNSGILVTSTVGANTTTITGGILEGINTRDLVILQNNTNGALQIGSTIVQNNNGGQLTKSGLGDLILSGTSSYANFNYINEGKVIVTSETVAGATKTGTATTGSAILTGVDTTGLWIGQRVTGTSLTANSYYIVAINSGSNTVTLSNNGSITSGAASFDMSAGSGLGSLTTGTAVQIASGATLQVGNGGTTGNLLSSQGIVNNGTLTFNRTNAFTFSSTTFGTGSVVQAGSGTTTLAGVHSYTGATVVNAGTLLVAGSVNSSAATVNSGGSLGGTGSVGSATVNAGGAMTPGSGGIGTLSTSNGNLVWNGEASGTFGQMKFELSNVGSTSDVIALGTGMLDKNTGSVFSFDFQGTGLFNTTYTLITFGSTDFLASDFSYTNLGSGLTGTFAVNGGSLQFTTVPEPSVVVLSGLGLALVLWRARRRANAVS